MEQNWVTREPYDKRFLEKEPICYNRDIPLCLLLEQSFLNLKIMNATHTLLSFNMCLCYYHTYTYIWYTFYLRVRSGTQKNGHVRPKCTSDREQLEALLFVL